MLPDRWNPRVWLRDWLMKPTATEISAAARPVEVSPLLDRFASVEKRIPDCIKEQ